MGLCFVFSPDARAGGEFRECSSGVGLREEEDAGIHGEFLLSVTRRLQRSEA